MGIKLINLKQTGALKKWQYNVLFQLKNMMQWQKI